MAAARLTAAPEGASLPTAYTAYTAYPEPRVIGCPVSRTLRTPALSIAVSLRGALKERIRPRSGAPLDAGLRSVGLRAGRRGAGPQRSSAAPTESRLERVDGEEGRARLTALGAAGGVIQA